MGIESDSHSIQLICVIVNNGIGRKVLHTAKRCGVTGGTELLGKGTVSNRILDYLGISDTRKEIVLMVTSGEVARKTLEKINSEFKFGKPNHGIAFTMPVGEVVDTHSFKSENKDENRGENNTMFQAITTIVDRGKAEDVIAAASKAGSKGGTIINGRGSGIHETSKLFAMDIEPEKEIVLILSQRESTEAIVKAISEKLKINEPGNGIIFVQNVDQTYGIYT